MGWGAPHGIGSLEWPVSLWRYCFERGALDLPAEMLPYVTASRSIFRMDADLEATPPDPNMLGESFNLEKRIFFFFSA